MLYGFREGTTVTIVAADRSEELDAFVENAPAAISLEEVDAFTLMVDGRFKGLKRAYTAEAATLAANDIHVTLVEAIRAHDVQRNMVRSGQDDPYRHGSVENRSIAEIAGINKVDPWDQRDDEQKAKDAEMDAKRQEMRDKKKGSALSGESFSGSRSTGEGEPEVGLTDIRMHKDRAGNIKVGEVIAQKGLWESDAKPKLVAEPGIYWEVTINQTMGNTIADLPKIVKNTASIPYTPVFAQDVDPGTSVRLLFATQKEGEIFQEDFRQHFIHVATVTLDAVDQFGDPVSQNRIRDANFSKYYRVDIHGIGDQSFDALVAQMTHLSIDKIVLDRGTFDEDNSTGVWTVSGVQRIANRLNEALLAEDPSLVTEVYAVNVDNERLVPKGTVVVDDAAEREIGPRPWNDRAAEWDAWTDEQREEEIKKNVKGDEFLYAGSFEPGQGSMFWIVPKDWFAKQESIFPQSLPISHFFPEDFEEKEPGVYQTRTRDWNEATFAVGQRGIRESMTLRLWLNHR